MVGQVNMAQASAPRFLKFGRRVHIFLTMLSVLLDDLDDEWPVCNPLVSSNEFNFFLSIHLVVSRLVSLVLYSLTVSATNLSSFFPTQENNCGLVQVEIDP